MSVSFSQLVKITENLYKLAVPVCVCVCVCVCERERESKI